MSAEPTKSARPPLSIPYLVLAVSLILTFAAAAFVASSAAAKDRVRFENAVERTQIAINQRIDTYVNLLRGGAGLFATSGEISRATFATYVARLELDDHFPGIQGIGISARLTPDGLEKGIERMRTKEGFDDFKVFPPGARTEYHTIIFLEPLTEHNRKAIGYDMFTEPTRRAAMELARDTGQPATSGKVKLIQEGDDDAQAGFLVYMPIYYFARIPQAVEYRRIALAGFCYAPFRADDFLAGLFSSQRLRADMNLEVYDGDDSNNAAALMHRSPAPPEHQPRFTKTTTVQLPGRQWTITYRSGPDFDAASARGYTLMVIAIGGLLSVVLFTLTASQASTARRAEEAAHELRRSEQALRTSESKFRRLADANLVGVAFASVDGRMTDANDEMCRLLGRTKTDALSGRVRWNVVTPSHWRQADEQAVEQIRESGACVPYEKEFARPDGTTVPVLVGIAKLEGDSGDCVALAVDLTVRKAAERELIQAKEVADGARADAEQASRLKDEFLATVSHELRTPLNAIFGWAQLLRGGQRNGEDLEHGLETIERSARAQAQLIDDLLDVSRIVAGKLRLDMQAVQLAPVVEAAIASIRPAAEAKGVELIPALEQSAVIVNGDPHRIQQIVWNLLANAVKFTPRAGSVRVTLQHDKSEAIITVSDTGIGVAHEFLPHLFERFRQADPSSTRSYGGLGLGLAIVRHLVELHGGAVEAHSEGEARGATFRVKLPLARTHASAARSSDDDDRNHRLEGVRVLLVEDDPDSRELVVEMLGLRGANITATASVSDAMAAIEAFGPHVVISDIGMPNEDGYALLSRIRALPGAHRGVPVVALTALARPEDRRRALLAGFAVHLSKPIDARELTAVVHTLTADEIAARK